MEQTYALVWKTDLLKLAFLNPIIPSKTLIPIEIDISKKKVLEKYQKVNYIKLAIPEYY